MGGHVQGMDIMVTCYLVKKVPIVFLFTYTVDASRALQNLSGALGWLHGRWNYLHLRTYP